MTEEIPQNSTEPMIDLERIESLAKSNWSRNWNFRDHLLTLNSDVVDQKVFYWNKYFSDRVDCTKCANCCRQADVLLESDDLNRLSSALKIQEMELFDGLVGANERGDWQICQKPCPLLKENKCSIYLSRPTDCRSFPHLDLDGFVDRLEGVIESYRFCPIVFNVLEALIKDPELRSC